jgi:hypothetical protein
MDSQNHHINIVQMFLANFDVAHIFLLLLMDLVVIELHNFGVLGSTTCLLQLMQLVHFNFLWKTGLFANVHSK